MALVGGGGAEWLGWRGGGAHDSTPHNFSTQGWTMQQPVVHWLPLSGTYKHCIFIGLAGTHCTMALCPEQSCLDHNSALVLQGCPLWVIILHTFCKAVAYLILPAHFCRVVLQDYASTHVLLPCPVHITFHMFFSAVL